jgi:rhodanese-related sulfurtransferase
VTFNQEWRRIEVNKIRPRNLYKLLQKKPLYVLDVRPLSFQRDASFIPEAYLCPLVYLEKKYNEIPKDKNIVITDWAMKQAPIAAKFLIKKNYMVTGVLKGGMERWELEGFPVEQRKAVSQVGPLHPKKNLNPIIMRKQ